MIQLEPLEIILKTKNFSIPSRMGPHLPPIHTHYGLLMWDPHFITYTHSLGGITKLLRIKEMKDNPILVDGYSQSPAQIKLLLQINVMSPVAKRYTIVAIVQYCQISNKYQRIKERSFFDRQIVQCGIRRSIKTVHTQQEKIAYHTEQK